jgi:beta-barrel assembly-enhancing protease
MRINLGWSGKRRRLCSILLSTALVSLWAQENVDPRKGRVTASPTAGNRYSIEQDIQLGRQGVNEINSKLTLLPAGHPMSKYIASLGKKLADNAPGYKFPYTFTVVSEKSVNAFALPGGPIYVHTGLIEFATESELAGVLGHEIAHVAMRHSTRQASRQTRAQLPLAILGGALGMGVGGLAGSLAQIGMSFAAGTVFMKYSRDAETEADLVGAQIMHDTGYDPQAIVSFFNKLKEQSSGGRTPQFLSSHPDPGNRAKEITNILSQFPAKEYRQSESPEFLAAKKALTGVKVGENKPESSTPLSRLSLSNIADSNFKDFQHEAYTISYPANWRVRGDSTSTVTIYPEGGVGENSIAYGAMIDGFQPQTSASKELDVAMTELIADIEQTNPELRLYSSPQVFTLGSLPARKLDWVGKSPVQENGEPLKERVRLVALPGKSGVVLYAVFVAPDPDFNSLWPTFERMLNSLQVR